MRALSQNMHSLTAQQGCQCTQYFKAYLNITTSTKSLYGSIADCHIANAMLDSLVKGALHSASVSSFACCRNKGRRGKCIPPEAHIFTHLPRTGQHLPMNRRPAYKHTPTKLIHQQWKMQVGIIFSVINIPEVSA
jgi:hypothetical protein